MNQTSNRYSAYCKYKGLDPCGKTGNLVEYANWIASREREYKDEKGLTTNEFYKEEARTRKMYGTTEFEVWLNEWSEPK